MAAAFELTRPEHHGKYRVTIYQRGFRLGGKGASGRGPSQRIEEHGLHLWMGFYENAFRLMRECYAEAARDKRVCPIADWQDAFVPDNFNAVADRSPSGAWLPWTVRFPPLPGLPGDPDESTRSWSVADYMARTIILLRTLLEAVHVRNAGGGAASRIESGIGDTGTLVEALTRIIRLGRLTTFGALMQALQFMERALGAVPQYPAELLLGVHEVVARAVREQLEAQIAREDDARRLWDIIELSLAVIRGAIRHKLMTDPRGFDAIDEFDCREWLHENGASKRAVDSAFVRALYDLAFAYEDGDCARPRIAAGQALRGAVRAFFTYRGAFFWKMQAGMGDVVFAPFWEVLRRRGVRFEFFHRLETLGVADDPEDGRPYIDRLEFAVQAHVRNGAEYLPLIDVGGLPSWPSQPDWAQLVEGDRQRAQAWDFESSWDERKVATKTLRASVDFDCVVLAVGVGALPKMCGELAARSEKWRLMLEHAKSVQTQAFQIWLNEDMRALGWTAGPVNMSGFVEPFDTWADMTHLIAREQHAYPVRAIAYFCSVLPDSLGPGELSDPRAAQAQVRANAVRFLNHDIRHLWPHAVQSGEFRWSVLATADDQLRGSERFSSQYWRANIDASDRYALSLPGTLRHRISPLDASFDNLTIAGDYTDCGFNEGCVEAAVMSGRLAAHAISESPPLETIVGYDHP